MRGVQSALNFAVRLRKIDTRFVGNEKSTHKERENEENTFGETTHEDRERTFGLGNSLPAQCSRRAAFNDKYIGKSSTVRAGKSCRYDTTPPRNRPLNHKKNTTPALLSIHPHWVLRPNCALLLGKPQRKKDKC